MGGFASSCVRSYAYVLLRAADLSRSQRLSRPFSAVQRDFLFLPEEAGDSTPTEPPVTAVVTTLEQEVCTSGLAGHNSMVVSHCRAELFVPLWKCPLELRAKEPPQHVAPIHSGMRNWYSHLCKYESYLVLIHVPEGVQYPCLK